MIIRIELELEVDDGAIMNISSMEDLKDELDILVEDVLMNDLVDTYRYNKSDIRRLAELFIRSNADELGIVID